MGSYVFSNLSSGERVFYKGSVSWMSQLPIIVIGFALLFVYGIGVLLFIAAYLNVTSTELAITNKRVIAKFGFVSRKTVEIKLEKIESVQVDQSIPGRIFNFGSIIVAGAGGPQAPIPNVSDPLKFRAKLNELIERREAA